MPHFEGTTPKFLVRCEKGACKIMEGDAQQREDFRLAMAHEKSQVAPAT